MEYNWNSIKSTIKTNCEHAFAESALTISQEELEEDLIVFNNFLQYPMPGCDGLRALENKFLEALQNVCLNMQGIQSYLDTITTDFEAFMKKILILRGSHHYPNLIGNTWMFEKLFRELSIANNFYTNGHKLGAIESIIENFQTDPEGVYIVAKSRMCRNEIHEAKNLDLQQIGAAIKYSIAMYVWIIHKTKSSILSNVPELGHDEITISSSDQDNRYLYDLLSFGKTANEVKNKIVDSFILNRIFNNEPKRVTDLISEVDTFSKGSLDKDTTNRFITKLASKPRLHYNNAGGTEVILTDQERSRLQHLSNLYAEAISRLKTLLKSEIDALSSTYDLDKLISIFSDFLDDNFSKDIEVFEGDGDNNTYSNYKYLIRTIEQEGFSHEDALKVYKILVTASKSNKVLYKLSLGRVVSKLSNNATFENYARQPIKEVFLDTQIVLYMLCLHEDLPRPTKGLISVAQHIVDAGRKHRTISLKFPQVYVYEVINHFRRALNLILLTEKPGVDGMQISNNVFYKHYCKLKEDFELPEGIDSFCDYMSQIYSLKYKDLNGDFKGVAKSIISDILSENFNVTLHKITPYYNDEDLSSVADIFTDVIKEEDLENKEGNRLKADSIVGKFLFDGSFNNEPFFLTYDRSFKGFKTKYKEQYKRRTPSFCWHLLSPSQFLNHIDLMNLKIDEGRLTNELLSFIESDDFDLKSHTLIDDICRFLDVPGLSPEQKEKSLKALMKDMVGDGEFSHQIETINTGGNLQVKNFCELSNDVFTHYIDLGGEILSEYASLFADSEKRQKLFDVIKSYSNNIGTTEMEKVYYEIETLFSKTTSP